MKEQLVQIVVENIGVIVAASTTALIAFIKRKLDIRKMKKEGRLVDKPIYSNGTPLKKV